MGKIDLSVVIPAYNEEKTIQNTLGVIYDFFRKKGLNFEIIVVDDGSSDLTALKVNEIKKNISCINLVSYPENAGKGEAVRQGVMVSKGALILFSDADLSTPVSEIEKFLPFIHQGYDIVIGSRRIKNSLITRKQPFHRRISGRIFQLLVRCVLKLPYSDTQCGFKLFKANIAKELFSSLVHKGFIFDVEIVYKANVAGYKIKETGVIWANDPTTTVRFFKDSLKCFIDLVKIRFGK
ncbi:MAG: glycosyltransferase family 2 protein [Candidatus Omnitrophica bacterium]|nr:glycosyltransferase family 2 protein [Candidatus Omnitrophota bacterium]MCM8828780.1 glycosyltransferase family 2 protein [Candidatus Omnitrophota bacterium]